LEMPVIFALAKILRAEKFLGAEDLGAGPGGALGGAEGGAEIGGGVGGAGVLKEAEADDGGSRFHPAAALMAYWGVA